LFGNPQLSLWTMRQATIILAAACAVR